MPLQLVQDLEVDALERQNMATVGWPVAWSAVWVGALAGVAATVMFGLCGIAMGAHRLEAHPLAVRPLGWPGVVAAVGGAFLSFVIGGWIAGRLSGNHRSETSALHGAIAWLVAVPILIELPALGAAPFGQWWSGLAARPVLADTRSEVPPPMVRHAAAGTATALLLGLMGGVLGGWLAGAV